MYESKSSRIALFGSACTTISPPVSRNSSSRFHCSSMSLQPKKNSYPYGLKTSMLVHIPNGYSITIIGLILPINIIPSCL